jgi:hypothetical protein
MSILRPRRPMRRAGRTKSTSHWPGTPSRTRFSWCPTQRTLTTLCARNAVFLPHPHWLSRDPFQSGLRVRECSLPRTADRAQRPTLKMNTFTIQQAADAEFRGKTRGKTERQQTALNAVKNGMSRETVTRRDAERRGMAQN